MALLGQGWDDPRSAAVMALAGGLLRGDAGGGLLASDQAYRGVKSHQVEDQLRKMQMENYVSEIEARKAQIAKEQQRQALIQQVLGGGSPGGMPSVPAAPGQLGSGSFGVVPPPAGRPAIPQAAPQGSRLASLSMDQLAALKMAGVDLTDVHKYANDPLKMESGSTYRDRVTGQERYMPRLPEGMAPGGNGSYAFVPGYAQSVAGLEGLKANATEGARANFDPVQVVGPDGAARYVPRAQVVAPQPQGRPAEADRFAILSQELARARASGNTGDAAAIQREIDRLPAAARTSANPSGLSVPGFQATPTTAQRAEQVRAEQTAKDDVARDTGKKADEKRFNQMMTGVDRAIELLQQGPTGSGFGRAVDSAAGFIGQSTKGAELSQQLKVLSGWLTSNVPRMEGPQSDRDVIQYREMAAMVGDESVPVERRLAAAQELKTMQNKYANLNGWNGAEGTWENRGGKTTVVNDLPKTAKKGARARDTATGQVLMFNGISWVPEK